MSQSQALNQWKQQQEYKQDQRREQRRLEQAFNQDGDLSKGWMEEMIGTDDLEERLQPATIRKIQGMLNKQWVLSNLTKAETHDRTYWLEVQRLKILGEHPPQGSVIRGELRAFLEDDPWEELQPLSPGERNTIDQVIKSLQNMVARSRDGFERKQANTSIARTESDEPQSGNSGGLFDFSL